MPFPQFSFHLGNIGLQAIDGIESILLFAMDGHKPNTQMDGRKDWQIARQD
jgi:hypothetical protein